MDNSKEFFKEIRTPQTSDSNYRVSDEQRAAARKTVAGLAEDAKDAVQIMLMLGIFPGQEDAAFQIPDAYRFDWC